MEDSSLQKNITYKTAAYTARILKLLMTGLNLENIPLKDIEIKELDNLEPEEYLNYIKGQSDDSSKKASTSKNFSNAYTTTVQCLIEEIKKNKKNSDIDDNILKLSSYFYLYKISIAKDCYEENDSMEKIDDVISKIILSKDRYYNILINLGQINKDMFGGKKEEKEMLYFKIIFFLNLTFFKEELEKFFVKYNIDLPEITFDKKYVKDKLKEIDNLVYILKKSEEFKTHERFEYYNAFKDKPDLIKEVNYVLFKKNKNVIISLDRVNEDITEEAINFALNNINVSENEEDSINNLQSLYESEKLKKENMEKEFEKLKNEYSSKFEKLRNNYSNNINSLEETIKNLKKINVENRTKKNQQDQKIKELENNLAEKDDIIEKISYREVGSKIIEFYSSSLTEQQKEENEKNNISSRNVNIISNNIKSNFSNYNNYLNNKSISLRNVLKKIKKEKNDYDELVHGKPKKIEKYLEIIGQKDKEIVNKIKLLFDSSKLMNDYVFNKKSTVSGKDIYDEFVKLNKTLNNSFP